jgi:hypothetical protein
MKVKYINDKRIAYRTGVCYCKQKAAQHHVTNARKLYLKPLIELYIWIVILLKQNIFRRNKTMLHALYMEVAFQYMRI